MKTLTLFRAYVMAEAARQHLLSQSSPYRGDMYSIAANRLRRQRNKFGDALTKRLQEQEEELEMLKAYFRGSIGIMVSHGFDYFDYEEWRKDCKRIREQTSEWSKLPLDNHAEKE